MHLRDAGTPGSALFWYVWYLYNDLLCTRHVTFVIVMAFMDHAIVMLPPLTGSYNLHDVDCSYFHYSLLCCDMHQV